ncbi:hypothetical protein D3C78_1342070 [compost metagenome]
MLPPKFATTLSGHLELFTDRLRYREGQVDTHYDSRDTLAHVIRDYLQRRFATRNVELAPLPGVSLPARELEVAVEARVDGQLQQLPLQLFKSDERGWRVRRDSFPPLAEPVAEVQASESASEALAVVENVRPVDRRLRFSLQRLLNNPSQYQELGMRVYTQRGSTAEGRFAGLDREGRLLIRRNLGGAGAASYSLAVEEIERIELLEP